MNIIYIHVCCISNYKEIFAYLMDCIKKVDYMIMLKRFVVVF